MTHHIVREVMDTDSVAALPALLTMNEAMAQLRIGRTQCFDLIKSGALESVKIGRSRRVPASAITAYIERLRAMQGGGSAA